MSEEQLNPVLELANRIHKTIDEYSIDVFDDIVTDSVFNEKALRIVLLLRSSKIDDLKLENKTPATLDESNAQG